MQASTADSPFLWPVAATDTAHSGSITRVGSSCIQHILSFVPWRFTIECRGARSYQGYGGQRLPHNRVGTTVAVGWLFRLAHTCRAIFDAVKLAHLSYLQSLADHSYLRHPLWHFGAGLRQGRYPYRWDQTIHLITRNRPVCPPYFAGFYRRRFSDQTPIPPYVHYSQRRSLAIQDRFFERPGELPHTDITSRQLSRPTSLNNNTQYNPFILNSATIVASTIPTIYNGDYRAFYQATSAGSPL
jgi:hypothetical protein